MPRYDQTGPLGKGQMTGGRKGICQTPQDADLPNVDLGFQGVGRGGIPRGGGRGRCGGGFGANQRGNFPSAQGVSTQQDDNDRLRSQLSEAQREIEALKTKINELFNKA
jgi:hypothetical protein